MKKLGIVFGLFSLLLMALPVSAAQIQWITHTPDSVGHGMPWRTLNPHIFTGAVVTWDMRAMQFDPYAFENYRDCIVAGGHAQLELVDELDFFPKRIFGGSMIDNRISSLTTFYMAKRRVRDFAQDVRSACKAVY